MCIVYKSLLNFSLSYLVKANPAKTEPTISTAHTIATTLTIIVFFLFIPILPFKHYYICKEALCKAEIY